MDDIMNIYKYSNEFLFNLFLFNRNKSFLSFLYQQKCMLYIILITYTTILPGHFSFLIEIF